MTDVDRQGLIRLNFSNNGPNHSEYYKKVDRYSRFYDLDYGTSLFAGSHARKIIDFVNKHWNDVDYFLVNCDKGMTRSASVAAACQKIHGMDDSYWFKEKTPNVRIYRKILEYNEG